jgi:ABC-type glycerol-3-phosphate transport system permease component
MRHRIHLSRYSFLNLVVSLILGVICLAWIYPFLWPIFASFKTSEDMFSSGARLWPTLWTFENYGRAWVNAHFGVYFGNSIFYSTTATALSVIISAMCGYILARYRFPGSRLLQRLILALLFIPTATTAIPIFKMMQGLGLLNTRWAILLAMTGGGGLLTLGTLLFSGFFRGIPQDLYDAAVVDGANFPQQFWLVLPLTRPIIATMVIFNFLATWTDFFTPLIFSLGKPELRTLAVGLRVFTGTESNDITGFAAATTISIVPILIVFLLFQRHFVRGLSGAIKG